MPNDRTWDCRNFDAGFWKDTSRNIAALGGLVPHQWTEQDEKYVVKQLKEIPF